MPYKSEKIKLNETQDRRRKLTEEQKVFIRNEYTQGNISLNALAKKYDVSKSLILIVVNPKRAECVNQRIKDHWKDYADREQLTIAMRNTRRYKQELYLDGKLIDKN